MKQKTETEAYLTLAALCAQAEHCQWEMLEKMRRWELSDEAQARVMERLVNERYVDDERYTRAFVKDKVRYNKWGRRKVEQALWQKHIEESIRHRIHMEKTRYTIAEGRAVLCGAVISIDDTERKAVSIRRIQIRPEGEQ